MPPRRTKQTDADIYLKRRSAEQGLALVDAAHIATHRLYCETLKFWRRCALRTCRRHRRCLGEPTGCLMRGLPSVPPAARLEAEKQVIAGGPRRLAPTSHIEWCLRRTELATVTSWGFGRAPSVPHSTAVLPSAEQILTRDGDITPSVYGMDCGSL